MFYSNSFDSNLRLGDIVKGYVCATPKMSNPVTNDTIIDILHEGYKIDVRIPTYSVVLSPCCQIKEQSVALAPLVRLNPIFAANPFLTEDFTRLNRPMAPKLAVDPDKWERMGEEDRRNCEQADETYAFKGIFVYEKHDLFSEYMLTYKKKRIDLPTNYYMVDFKSIYRLNCDSITRNYLPPIETKVLQLSINTRSELREKLAFYFGKPPGEDMLSEE